VPSAHGCSSAGTLFSKALDFEYHFDNFVVDARVEATPPDGKLYVKRILSEWHTQYCETTRHVIALRITHPIAKYNYSQEGEMC
jgi:hypothetical protein